MATEKEKVMVKIWLLSAALLAGAYGHTASEMCDLMIGHEGFEVSVTKPPTTWSRDHCQDVLRSYLPYLQEHTRMFCQCIKGSAQS